MNDSYVVGKERCPECAKLGKDQSGDNLAIYSDSHKYCFSCGYISSVSGIPASYYNRDTPDVKDNQVYLPSDCDIIYPDRAMDWIRQYGLTKIDLLNNNVLWSDSMQRLIFPVYGDGQLIAWQGRSFHTQNHAIAPIPKWFGLGNLKDTYNILGSGDKLVIVEDIVSAVKVAKCGVMAMPLYGSFIGVERSRRLYKLLGPKVEILVWLDPDKASESIREAKRGSMYFPQCSPILSDKDPKEHDIEFIKNILTS